MYIARWMGFCLISFSRWDCYQRPMQIVDSFFLSSRSSCYFFISRVVFRAEVHREAPARQIDDIIMTVIIGHVFTSVDDSREGRISRRCLPRQIFSPPSVVIVDRVVNPFGSLINKNKRLSTKKETSFLHYWRISEQSWSQIGHVEG